MNPNTTISRLTGAHKERGLIYILGISLFVGCSGASANMSAPSTGNRIGIANPASVNCIAKGGTLSIQKSADGGDYGICTFDNGRQCEEWALFRGECSADGKKNGEAETHSADERQ